jgi:hypothetical protein
LLDGVLYAASPRIDWANLLRRTFDVDVLACRKCHGRLRVLSEVTDPAMVRLALESLGLPRISGRLAPVCTAYSPAQPSSVTAQIVSPRIRKP